MAAGVSSDHEITSGADFLEKLRAGMTVELRGSHDYVLPEVVEALKTLPRVPATLTICTDDVPPDELLERGGICDVLRRLVRYGMDPVQAICCATLNAANRIRRSDLGLIAPGRTADIAVLRDLREMTVESTFVGGKLVARDGRMLAPIEAPAVAAPLSPKLPLRTLTAEEFRIAVPGVNSGCARLRAIKGVRFTSWGEVEVDVRNGFAQLPSGHSMLFVQHRHGQHKLGPQRALLTDWGELRGAIATTYSHDSHNLVVLGRGAAEMALAANTLIECGGGMAVVKDGRVLALAPMPIAGLLSPESPAEVAKAFAAVRAGASEVVEWKPPYRVFKAIEGTCLACNPGPHLTDLGLTDGTTGEILSGVLGVGK
jgi:adenine deaminase